MHFNRIESNIGDDNDNGDLHIPNKSYDEILEVCNSNNISRLNSLNLPNLKKFTNNDSIVKLDEGSSGIIFKVKLKIDRKSYVFKLMKSEEDVIIGDELESKPLSRSSSNKSNNNRLNLLTKSISNISINSTNNLENISPLKNHHNNNIDDENNDNKIIEKKIKPDYTFNTLNEYLIISKFKTKHIIESYGLFRYIEDEVLDYNDTESIDSEISSNDDHPQIFDNKPINIGILIDYHQNGDLLKLITNIRKKNLIISNNLKDFIMLQLVEGLKFLHLNEIIHRDIKPENILIDNLGKLKYSDFGYSIDINRIKDYPINDENFLIKGTNSFKPPEIVNFKILKKFQNDIINNDCKILKKIDIWSLIILYYQIKFLNKPWNIASIDNDNNFKKFNEKYQLNKINLMKTGFEMSRNFNLNENFGKNINSLKDDNILVLMNMMNPDYNNRWGIMEVYRSNWMLGVRMSLEDSNNNKSGFKGKVEENEIVKLLRIV